MPVNTGSQPATTIDGPKPKNENITFRLDSSMVSRLRKEADEKEISVNRLVSQIIKHYIDWHSIAPKAGFIPVRKYLVTHLLDKLSEEQLKANAEQVASTTNLDILMLFKNKISIESALDFIESWLKASDIVYIHERIEFKHTFVIHHNMGQQWSIYLGELYTHLFNLFKARDFKYEARHGTLSFVLETDQWFG